MGLATRLARRELGRRPARTALVVALIALPTAAMTATGVVLRTDERTSPQLWVARNGAADAAIVVDPAMGVPALPAGSRSLEHNRVHVHMRTDAGIAEEVEVSDLPTDGLIAGAAGIADGRRPERPGEVALTRRLADRFGIEVGDRLVLEEPDAAIEVVGIVALARCVRCNVAIVAPGSIGETLGDELLLAADTTLLVDLPPGVPVSTLVDLLEEGHHVSVRPGYDDALDEVFIATGDDSDGLVTSTLVLGGVVLLVAGTVIAAAFAVGARRQVVSLGQLALAGAPPSTLQRSMSLQGALTGAAGVAVGTVLAAVLLAVGRDAVERAIDHPIDGYRVVWRDLGFVAVLGVLTATVAAWLPARTAARIPTLAALAGRRPLRAVRLRSVAWGAGLLAGGLALFGLGIDGSEKEPASAAANWWFTVAVLGTALQLGGLICLAPWVAARSESAAGRLRGAWRLGARGLARQRTRTAAVVSAVGATGALAVGASALVLGSYERAERNDDEWLPHDMVLERAYTEPFEVDGWFHSDFAPTDPGTTSAIEAALPGSTATTLRHATRLDGASSTAWYYAVPGDPDRSRTEGPRTGPMIFDEAASRFVELPETAIDALDDGLLVLAGDVDPTRYPAAFHEPIDEPIATSVTMPDGRVVDAVVVTFASNDLGHHAGSLFVGERSADQLGLRAEPMLTVHEATSSLTDAQRQQLEEIDRGLGPIGAVAFHTPKNDWVPGVERALAIASLVITMLVVGAALALAAAESRDERDTLSVVGAAPGTLAGSAGARAWLLAATGAALAVPVGMLPVVVYSLANRTEHIEGNLPVVFPWPTVGVLVVVTPLVVALIAWAGSSVALRLRPVRISTMAFE